MGGLKDMVLWNYTNWLESVWFNGLDIERYEEFENTAYVDYTIYINWVK